MADAPDNPLAPRTRPPYYAGQPIEFAGYVDDFDRTICAMEFSLDDGASWTAYPTAAVDKSRGVNWRFVYTPETPGRYLLKVRPVTEDGEPSALVAGFAFEALPAGGTYGEARIRAVGGSFRDARIFRSRELSNLTGEEAAFLSGALGIASGGAPGALYRGHAHRGPGTFHRAPPQGFRQAPDCRRYRALR